MTQVRVDQITLPAVRRGAELGACTMEVPTDLAAAFGAAQDTALAAVGKTSLEEIYYVQDEYSAAFAAALQAAGWSWKSDPKRAWQLLYTHTTA